MFWTFFFFILGLAVLLKGSEFLIDGSAGLAKRFRISPFIVGITIVALGTSLPELFVSILAALKQESGLVIGNIVGSNIANIALIPGISAMIRPLRFDNPKIVRYEIPYVILAGLVLFLLGFDEVFQNHGLPVINSLTLGDGLIMLLFFTIFIFYIFGNLKIGKALESQAERKEKITGKEPLSKLIFLLIGGLLAAVGGGKLVVDNAVSIAQFLGVSETTIGLTIVAMGTSLPDISASVIAVAKKREDIGIGNLIGSNVINVFLVLGLTTFITQLTLGTFELFDVFFMIGLSILLFLFAYFRKQLTKISGVTFLILYVVYIIFVLYRDVALK